MCRRSADQLVFGRGYVEQAMNARGCASGANGGAGSGGAAMAGGVIHTTCPYAVSAAAYASPTDGDCPQIRHHPADPGPVLLQRRRARRTRSTAADACSIRYRRAIDLGRCARPDCRAISAGRSPNTGRTRLRSTSRAISDGGLLRRQQADEGLYRQRNIDTNSRLCMASSVAGHIRAFGEDIVPACYDDLGRPIWCPGRSNTAWCHPVLYQRLVAGADARHEIVVIDPRRTATATPPISICHPPGSDLRGVRRPSCSSFRERRLRPGVDARMHDRAGRGRRSRQQIRVVDRGLCPDCRLPIGDLDRFYDLFCSHGAHDDGSIPGVNQSSFGTDKVNAIINCHLATGRIGRPGMGPFR